MIHFLQNVFFTFARDIRVRLAVAVGFVLVSVLGFLAVDVAQATDWIQAYGYYVVLIPLMLSVYYLIHIQRNRPDGNSASGCSVWLRVGMVLLGAWLLFVQVDFGYKIAMDEYILSSTSQNIHESRQVMVTTRVAQYGDRMYPSETYVDKRPWLYPVLVSIVHDVTGYRAENAFYVNAALALCLLWGASRFGGEIAGDSGRMLAILLWVSLPLLAQNATGAGMELLNLCLLQWLVVVAVAYLKRPSYELEGMLSCLGVLLAYSRYESLLFLAPLLIVIVIGWMRKGQILLSGASVCASVVLLPLFWQLKRYATNEAAWELSGDSTQAYAWSHIMEHLPHALNFFFSSDGTLANSILLSALGAVGLLLFLISGPREWKKWSEKNVVCCVLWIFALFGFLQLASVIAFHAGELDRPFVSRYSLPFHLFLVGAILVLFWEVTRRWKRSVPYWLGGVSVFLLGYTLPTNARSVFTAQNYSISEQKWLLGFSEEILVPNSLIIDTYTIPWSLRDWVALNPSLAEAKYALIQQELRSGVHRNVYFVERLVFENGDYVPVMPVGLGLANGFTWSLLDEHSFRPFTMTRVYELKGDEMFSEFSKP